LIFVVSEDDLNEPAALVKDDQRRLTKCVLLAALAHPDDESFGAGGTLALYAQRGVQVHLVGDQPAVRKGLLMRLAVEQDFSVVCEATEGKSVIDLAGSLCPDVVLIDLDKLRIDGISTVKTLHSVCPQASIILLSMYDNVITYEQARNAGAAAFIAKSMPTDTLLATIRQVAR
jgi:DNA-binding NtrC family response regulator